ncbi:Na+/H+ antiporter NhaC [Tissierella creatinophila]|uniref:Malate-2H(+)/Na(+)-lactate antiporter n=1 Tax=Tissierella creatinophila DSM 6911 TaxID=1123403 RepID=A0A1U7M5Z6_TISCR|nr:Na+/H+ antiporter NhaC [Tissierella creatinophila]OLS02743.1 malate-2H(+)/Na(+)-lactate antiporter [Tissierella creatinophila DSM 6911]
MQKENQETNKKELPLILALLPILTVIIMGLLSVLNFKAGMNIPIMSGIIAAAIVGKANGLKWAELQKSLVDGVSRALPALFIVMIIGLIIGSWIQGGVIPALIYYSLKTISPAIFIPTACFVTAIVAVATGTSFASIATVGLALMATGVGMGFPPPLLAGAIISGAYFGDSISPLSDTTNLASALSGCTLFELLSHLTKTGIPALMISLVVYYIVGAKNAVGGGANLETIENIIEGLSTNFTITPLLLLIPLLTILFSIKKLPAIPSLIMVAGLGGLAAIFIQGSEIGSVIRTMTNGFVSETGNEMIDSLLTRGGINSMGGTVILLTTATAFGGILERIGSLDTLLNLIMKKVNSVGSLVLATVLSGLTVAFATGAQLLAIVIPARMFGQAYKEKNLHPKNLARVSQSIGTICINLVPWSVPALFAQNILGVDAVKFIPYIFFAYITLAINLIYGYTGFTMERIKDQT